MSTDGFLEPEDMGAQDGWEEKDLPWPDAEKCPKCKGMGGWNLTLNAYGPGRHFRACCANCNGYGYVPKGKGNHIHKWKQLEQIGNCLRREQCTICGQENIIDSSD